ncbi:MAG TPA: DUF2948 family protein, partial [Methylovirgula sp.]
MTAPLRLIALDTEDLAIMSAHLQDSLVTVGEMAYLPRSKRFAAVAARFDWVAEAEGKKERCETGFHFERVLKVSRSGFSQQDPTQRLMLLSVAFDEIDSPAGQVVLTFSGGAAIKLDVECLEAQVQDLGR